jgi:hypothetical protein
MVPLGDEVKWKLVSVLSEIVLTLPQDRWTVCVECSIGSEIILDAADGTRRQRGSYGISLLSISR